MLTQAIKAPLAKRIDWVDYAKGIGIFLVVFGHELRALPSTTLSNSSLLEGLVDWIYTFHMPLFFFLSGLFIHRSQQKPLGSFVVDRLRTIAYPYFIWSILQEILRIASGRVQTNRVEAVMNLWQIIYQPVMQFWFLYVLLLISILYAIAHKLRLTSTHLLGISVLLLVIHFAGISFGGWGVLYQLRWYAIYFAIGAALGSGSWLFSALERFKSPTLFAIAGGGWGTIALSIKLGLLSNTGGLNNPVEPIFAMIGIAASVCFARGLEQFNFANFIKFWGTLSLPIYVAHSIFAAVFRAILQRVLGVEISIIYLIVYIVVGTTIGIYAPIGLYLICQKIGLKLFTLKAQPIRN